MLPRGSLWTRGYRTLSVSYGFTLHSSEVPKSIQKNSAKVPRVVFIYFRLVLHVGSGILKFHLQNFEFWPNYQKIGLKQPFLVNFGEIWPNLLGFIWGYRLFHWVSLVQIWMFWTSGTYETSLNNLWFGNNVSVID